MKMSKRIVSLVITVIMLLGMTALFPSAAAPSLKLVDWKRNDLFTYEFTGAGADSWVGIYYASETPGADTAALLWKTTGGKADGTDTLTNGAIQEYLQDKTGGTRYNENFVTLNPGDYKICLFKDGGYEVVAEQKFTVKKYNVMKDKKSVYVSDLKWTSWVVYKQKSDDVQSETNPDGLPLDKITNKPYFDRQVGGFNEASKQFEYGDGAPATTNLIINVAGINYEKGVSLALAKEIRYFEKAGKEEKYCEVSFDISGLDVNTFSCVFGKNTPGQVGWPIGGCEIIADEKVCFAYYDKIAKKDSIDVKCDIPAGAKKLILRAYSWEQNHQSGGVNFADAKLYKSGSASTSDMGIAVSAIALVVAASAAAVALSKKH